MALEQKTRDFRFEVKAVNEDGTFTGLASTYGNVDYGDDIVEPGAFTKTLQEQGDEVVLLWMHDPKTPIGSGKVRDSAEGLWIEGQFDLDTPDGKTAYTRAKKRYVKGLSIGYETVKKEIKEGVRHLKEIKLHEISLVTFGMNPQALVTSVKTRERKDDFLMELDEAQTWAFRYQAMNALDCSLCDTLCDSEMSDEDKASASSDAIQQFHDKYLEMLPKMTALMAENDSAMGMMARQQNNEAKAGRRISAATRKRIESVMQELQTLLAGEAAQSTSTDGAVAADADAKAKVTEPDWFHSLADRYTKSLKGVA